MQIFTILVVNSFFILAVGQKNVPDELKNDGNPSNPGVQFRLTQQGADFINTVFTEVMNDQLGNLNIEDIRHESKQGSFEIKNLHTIEYKKPDMTKLDLVPPNRLSWTMRNMNLALQANVKVDYRMVIPIQGDGTLTATGHKIDFDIQAAITSTDDGRPQLEVTKCDVNYGDLDANAVGTGNAVSMFNTLKGIFLKMGQKEISKKLCKALQKHVSGKLNDKLETLSMKAALGKRKDSAAGKFTNFPAEDYYFDYRLMENPVVTEKFLETKHKGEISYKGQGGTPFNPAKMQIHDRTDHMIHAFASDFVLNSLLYQATVNNHLTVDLNETTVSDDMAQFLQITCSDNTCLGDILPELKEKFPNHIGEVHLEAGDMPYIIFGESKMRAEVKNGKIGIFPRNRDTKVRELALQANVDMEAEGNDVSVEPKEQRVHGKVDMKKFDVQVERSMVGEIPAEKQKDLSKLGESLLTDAANDRLDDGIPLPKMKSFELTNTNLYFKPRTLTMDTDIKADMDELKNEVHEEVQEAIDKNNEQNQG